MIAIVVCSRLVPESDDLDTSRMLYHGSLGASATDGGTRLADKGYGIGVRLTHRNDTSHVVGQVYGTC